LADPSQAERAYGSALMSRDAIRKNKLRNDPVVFAKAVLNLNLLAYQTQQLQCQRKRIVACWARQTGKTMAVAVKVIHFAFTNAGTTTLIVSRALRQSIF